SESGRYNLARGLPRGMWADKAEEREKPRSPPAFLPTHEHHQRPTDDLLHRAHARDLCRRPKRRFPGGTSMRLIVAACSSLVLVGLIGSLAAAAAAASPVKAPGLGDPGKLMAIEVIGGGAETSLLRGADDRLQLVVSGK